MHIQITQVSLPNGTLIHKSQSQPIQNQSLLQLTAFDYVASEGLMMKLTNLQK